MRILLLLAVILGIAGCNPAPSTPLAPDTQLPDTSKMSAEEVQKLHSEGSAVGKDAAAPQPGSASDHGYTPPDRTTGN